MAEHLSIFNSKKIPYSIIILIVIFSTFELVTRIVFRPHILPEEIYAEYSPNYDYGYDEKAPLFYKENDHLVLYSTSYLKFWRKEIPLIKSDNEFRLFVIGCSVSRGDYNSQYSFYMEQFLNENSGMNKFRVINCSATGIGSSRMLLILKKILSHQPDFIILHPDGTNEFEDERDLKEAQEVKASYQGIITKSWFFCVLKKYVDNNLLDKFKPQPEILPETYARWFVPGKRQEWLKTLITNITEMVNISKQNKTPIMFVSRAFNCDSLSVYENEETIALNNVLESFVQKDVYEIDTPSIFLSHFGPRFDKKEIFLDTVHWKPVAHKVIARKIIDVLKQKKIIDETSYTLTEPIP